MYELMRSLSLNGLSGIILFFVVPKLELTKF